MEHDLVPAAQVALCIMIPLVVITLLIALAGGFNKK